jgi:hypothetical protein
MRGWFSLHVLLTRHRSSREEPNNPFRHVASSSHEREYCAEREAGETQLGKQPPAVLLHGEEGCRSADRPAHEAHDAGENTEEWSRLIWANRRSFVLAHLTPALSRRTSRAKRGEDGRLERLVGHQPASLRFLSSSKRRCNGLRTVHQTNAPPIAPATRFPARITNTRLPSDRSRLRNSKLPNSCATAKATPNTAAQPGNDRNGRARARRSGRVVGTVTTRACSLLMPNARAQPRRAKRGKPEPAGRGPSAGARC